TSTTPTVDDYTNAGVTSVSSNILNYLNSHLGKEKREGLTHYLKASDVHSSDQYGWDMALSDDGNTLAVFARYAPSVDNNATDDAGATYVYRRSGATWQEVTILRTNQTTYHSMEMEMTADGRRIVMLAPTYLYTFDVPLVDSAPDWDGTWTMTSLNHGDTDSSQYLAMSADGSTLVIGEEYYSSYQGRIRIYQNVDGVWTYRQVHYAPRVTVCLVAVSLYQKTAV
ncbi:hypothetical protein UB34_20395, partial [Photobacterium leiognathi]